MEKIDLGKDLFLAMGKGKKTLEQAMETDLEKAAYRHLQYLSENPAYAEWWGSADSWDWERSLSKTQNWPQSGCRGIQKSLGKGKAKKAAELGKAEADQALQAKSKPKSKARPKFKEELEQEQAAELAAGALPPHLCSPSLQSFSKDFWGQRTCSISSW